MKKLLSKIWPFAFVITIFAIPWILFKTVPMLVMLAVIFFMFVLPFISVMRDKKIRFMSYETIPSEEKMYKASLDEFFPGVAIFTILGAINGTWEYMRSQEISSFLIPIIFGFAILPAFAFVNWVCFKFKPMKFILAVIVVIVLIKIFIT